MQNYIGDIFTNLQKNSFIAKNLKVIQENQYVSKGLKIINVAKEVYVNVQKEKDSNKPFEAIYLDTLAKKTPSTKK